ncbi:response regulator [Magnetospirillum sp. SS-4]|uniref:response regulator n=1 Tax=Magnetospirillum sp. SS-4 TaxID=2681465 RepID=UPI00137D3565
MGAGNDRKTILVVDDTPENLAIVAGVLKDSYRTRVATSGARALALAGSDDPPDLILLDIMMPEMDGYEVCRRLKGTPATAAIPVIFLTAKSEIEDEAKGFDAGAVDYIHKPFSPPIIRARVKTHLDLRDAVIAAERATRAKSAFLAMMSHEIRTPMSGVLGMIDLMGDTPLTDEQRRMLRVSRDSAQSLLRVINDILDFSKIEAGRMEVECIPLSVRAIIEGVAATLGHAADARNVRLTHAVEPAVPAWVGGDPVRLRQILFNLAGNAVKFTPAGGAVAIRGWSGGDGRLRIEVTDTGIGMSADQIGRLFKPFSQADLSTTRRFGGTGLGLSICRRLADLMGGEIAVASVEGQGSAFTLDLPAQAVEPPAETEDGCPTRSPAWGRTLPADAAEAERLGRLVLVAEDNETNQDVIRRQLARHGVMAEIAGDGRKALDAWRARRHPLVLTDCYMPEMDGFQLARAIRDDGGRCPILAVTASIGAEDIEACRDAGIDDWLAKPVEPERLLAALARWLPAWVDGEPSRPPSAAAPHPPSPALFDPHALAAMVGDDPAAIAEVLRDFIEPAGRMAADIQTALAGDDPQAAGRAAHKLKSSARAVGTQLLADCCLELEQAGKAGDRTRLAALADRFEPLFRRSMAAVARHIGEV